jgi:hypothetical protein
MFSQVSGVGRWWTDLFIFHRWAPTSLVSLFGWTAYALTEYLRRFFAELVGISTELRYSII